MSNYISNVENVKMKNNLGRIIKNKCRKNKDIVIPVQC